MSGATDNQNWTRQEMERGWPLDPVPEGKQVLMRIRDLNKRFGPRHILRGIDLDIDRGEAVGLVGPSGSGKTSLLMVLAGLERATSGSIVLDGREITGLNEDALAALRRSFVCRPVASDGRYRLAGTAVTPAAWPERRHPYHRA